MTSQHFVVVQQSFEAIRPISHVTAELFYAKLFDLDPSLRPMFKGDIKPMWEDPENAKGGNLQVQLVGPLRTHESLLDSLWQNLVRCFLC